MPAPGGPYTRITAPGARTTSGITREADAGPAWHRATSRSSATARSPAKPFATSRETSSERAENGWGNDPTWARRHGPEPYSKRGGLGLDVDINYRISRAKVFRPRHTLSISIVEYEFADSELRPEHKRKPPDAG